MSTAGTRGEPAANAGAAAPKSGASTARTHRPRRLYLVAWQGPVYYDMHDAVVVRACDREHAVEIALREVYGDQQDPALWVATTLREQGPAGVVLASYNAG